MPHSQLIAVGLLLVRCISEVCQQSQLSAGANSPPRHDHDMNLRQQATPPMPALRRLMSSSGPMKLSTRFRRQCLASTTSAASLMVVETRAQLRFLDREPRPRAAHKRRKQQQETTACDDAFACTTTAVSALSP